MVQWTSSQNAYITNSDWNPCSSDHSFTSKFHNKFWTFRPIHIGVPQGYFLLPIIFNIFINDIPTTTSAKVSIFADNTMFSASNHNIRFTKLQLQNQIDLAMEWFSKWWLNINVIKTLTILSRKIKFKIPRFIFRTLISNSQAKLNTSVSP